jgi:hypothetical protein
MSFDLGGDLPMPVVDDEIEKVGTKLILAIPS